MNLFDLLETAWEVVRGVFEFHWTWRDVVKYVIIVTVITGLGYLIIARFGGPAAIRQFDESRGGRVLP
jgi:hypothetical protein